MIRVKDAEKSLKFYQDVLGMKLLRRHESAAAGFNLYFLGYGADADGKGTADREGLLELTWNYGTEKDEAFSYHDGNKDPQGFGHICKCPRARESVLMRGGGGGVRKSKEGMAEAQYPVAHQSPRRFRRQPRGGLRAAGVAQRQLEEETDRRAHEERGFRPGPRRLLGRDCPERAIHRKGQLLKPHLILYLTYDRISRLAIPRIP